LARGQVLLGRYRCRCQVNLLGLGNLINLVNNNSSLEVSLAKGNQEDLSKGKGKVRLEAVEGLFMGW